MGRLVDADMLIEKLKFRLYAFKDQRHEGGRNLDAIYYRELETIYTIAVIDATAEEADDV